MTKVTIHEAKTHLSKLIRQVEAGEEVVIARGNSPVVKVVPYKPEGKRSHGALKGKIWIADDFDEPLDEFKEYM